MVDDLLVEIPGADISTALRAALIVAFRHKTELIQIIKEQIS